MKIVEEQLNSLGLFSLEKRRLMEGLMAAYSLLTRGMDGQLFSLVTVTGPQGMAWNCDRRGSGWMLGKGDWALNQAPQGRSHSTKPVRVQEAF